MREKPAQRVYFIRPIGMVGPVKIGCSVLPEKRRDTLATWSPFPLEVVAEITGGGEMERRFHAMFVSQYERQEWFAWSPELQAVIDAIAAGTFDVSTLPEPKRLPRAYGKTGTPKGQGWTEERKASARLHRAIRKAEASCGLVPDWDASAEEFLSDPLKHGITPQERDRRSRMRWAEYLRNQAAKSLQAAEDRIQQVAA